MSAIFGGIPEKSVLKAFQNEVWTSGKVLAELRGLTAVLEGRLSQRQCQIWKTRVWPLIERMREAKVSSELRLCRDPKDDAYLSLAKAIEADALLTGDADLLVLTRVQLAKAGLAHLRILTPRQFTETHGS